MISRIEYNLNCCGYSNAREATKCKDSLQTRYNSSIFAAVDAVVFRNEDKDSEHSSQTGGCRAALQLFLRLNSTTFASLMLLMVAFQVGNLVKKNIC